MKNTLFCPEIKSPDYWNLHFRALKFQNFLRQNTPRPSPSPLQKRGPTAPCWYSQLLYSNLLATSTFIETPLLNTKKAKLINKLIVRLPDRILHRITFFFCLLDLFILDLKKKKKTGEKRRVHPNKNDKCLFWIIFSTFLQNIFPFL